jgi:hypothetical protein
MKQLNEVVNHTIALGIKNKDEVFDSLKDNSNINSLSKGLQRECVNHHKIQIDRHLKTFSRNMDVGIGKHTFKDPSSYLNHIKANNNHICIPIDHINTHLKQIDNHNQREQEIHKEIHAHKGMDDMSL